MTDHVNLIDKVTDHVNLIDKVTDHVNLIDKGSTEMKPLARGSLPHICPISHFIKPINQSSIKPLILTK